MLAHVKKTNEVLERAPSRGVGRIPDKEIGCDVIRKGSRVEGREWQELEDVSQNFAGQPVDWQQSVLETIEKPGQESVPSCTCPRYILHRIHPHLVSNKL